MSEIAIAGNEEFLLGFRLAGVRNTFVVNGNQVEEIKKIMSDEKLGILVLDEKTLNALPDHFQDDLSKSVAPVVVSLSKEADSGNLRAQIIRAIGVDLWKK